MPFLMHMYIPDVDAAYAAALAAGATTVRPLEDAPYGDRTATVLNPWQPLVPRHPRPRREVLVSPYLKTSVVTAVSDPVASHGGSHGDSR